MSALSFPCMLLCPGIHCKVSLTAKVLMNELMDRARDWHAGLSGFALSSACSTDLPSVKITVLGFFRMELEYVCKMMH